MFCTCSTAVILVVPLRSRTLCMSIATVSLLQRQVDSSLQLQCVCLGISIQAIFCVSSLYHQKAMRNKTVYKTAIRSSLENGKLQHALCKTFSAQVPYRAVLKIVSDPESFYKTSTRLFQAKCFRSYQTRKTSTRPLQDFGLHITWDWKVLTLRND